MKRRQIRALSMLHVSVFLFGMAGLFGKLLLCSPLVIVWGRVVFAALCLWPVVYLGTEQQNKTNKYIYQVIALGGLLAFHWYAFFESIAVSSVAIGLIAFSTFPVFAAFLEPLFFGQSIRMQNVALALLALVGVYLMIPDLEFSSTDGMGVLWGMGSGLSFACVSIFNRKMLQITNSIRLAFHQDIVAAVLLFPFIFTQLPALQVSDWAHLMLLGSIFTGLAHTLFISSLKTVKVQTASVVAMLEPVYGIIAAYLLLQERPDQGVLLGGIIVLVAAVVVLLPFPQQFKQKAKPFVK